MWVGAGYHVCTSCRTKPVHTAGRVALGSDRTVCIGRHWGSSCAVLMRVRTFDAPPSRYRAALQPREMKGWPMYDKPSKTSVSFLPDRGRLFVRRR